MIKNSNSMDKIALRNDFVWELCRGDLFSWTVSKISLGKNMGFPVQNGQNFGFLEVSNKYRALRYGAEILYEFYPMKS